MSPDRPSDGDLREQGQEPHAKAAEKVAEHAERVGGYLTESDADRILHDAEDFGRRQPLAVVAAGAALGFAASRFLKASSRNRYERPVDARHQPQPDVHDDPPRDVPAVPAPGVV